MEALSMGAVCAPLFLVSLSSLPKPSLPSGENAHLSRGHLGTDVLACPTSSLPERAGSIPVAHRVQRKAQTRVQKPRPLRPALPLCSHMDVGKTWLLPLQSRRGVPAPACPVERMEWSGWRHRSASQTGPGLPSGPSFHEFPLISAVARPLPSWPHLEEGLQGGPPRPPGCPLGDGHSLGV